MAHQALATTPSTRESTPAIHAGTPDDGIKEIFDSLARRAFAIFESNGRPSGRELADWFQAERELFHAAHMEVSESNDGFSVRVEVPGFSAKDVEINLEGRRLTISGRREKRDERKDKNSVYSESCSDQVFRVVDLPADVNAEGAKANLKDGILELEIPKATPAKKVPIASKAA